MKNWVVSRPGVTVTVAESGSGSKRSKGSESDLVLNPGFITYQTGDLGQVTWNLSEP